MISRRMLLLGLACAPLAACGRKSPPKPPDGSTFPRKYPDIDPPETKTETESTGSQGQSR